MITGHADGQRNCGHTEGDDQRPCDPVNKHPKRREFMMVVIEHLALIKGSWSQLKDATECMPPRRWLPSTRFVTPSRKSSLLHQRFYLRVATTKRTVGLCRIDRITHREDIPKEALGYF